MRMKIGTDIVQILRIETSVEQFGERFLNRFLTQEEQKILRLKPESLAGYWAAKEAVAKALGCGIGRELGFHDIRLNYDQQGAPHCTLPPWAHTKFDVHSIALSISHDGGFAIAVAAIT